MQIKFKRYKFTATFAYSSTKEIYVMAPENYPMDYVWIRAIRECVNLISSLQECGNLTSLQKLCIDGVTMETYDDWPAA